MFLNIPCNRGCSKTIADHNLQRFIAQVGDVCKELKDIKNHFRKIISEEECVTSTNNGTTSRPGASLNTAPTPADTESVDISQSLN